MRLFCSAAVFVLFWCGGSPSRAVAVVVRDRTAFNAASQNLRTIDFESEPPNFDQNPYIDGIVFQNLAGPPNIISGPNGKMLLGRSAGEITRLTIFLPPGTTAVGCDQFGTPMILSISSGESVTMDQTDGSRFVGFISEHPIQSVTVFFDFPEPTPDAVVDNLSFGQRRAGSEPPVPQLLVTNIAGRTIGLESVMNVSEPFHVLTSHNLSADGHTRVTLFVVGVSLEPADLPLVTVQAEDVQQRVFNLPCEGTGRATNLSWLSQVTVRLPDTLAAGELNVSVTVRGVRSNGAPLRLD